MADKETNTKFLKISPLDTEKFIKVNELKKVSNPIASKAPAASRLEKNQKHENNGLSVKSGYSIDAQRGFYVVNMDGVSAIVGKIKDNIFILKKFNHVVNGQIQVRRDDDNIYIVRLGKFKCLVNVEQDKMGTLIEI